METPIKLLILIFLVTCSHSLSISNVGNISCPPTSNNQVFSKVPTVATFCPGPELSCCTESWEGLIESTWTDLFAPLVTKFEQLRASLTSALHLIDGLHCPSTTSLSNSSTETTSKNLMKSTESGLSRLISVKWTDFLSSGSATQECKLKLVQAQHCPADCLPVEEEKRKPCRGYCLNILHGCFHGLAENLQLPWKHAVNSVRTALRLIHTQEGCIGLPSIPRDLEFLLQSMNTWREPLTWIDAVCELVASSNLNNLCFDGKTTNATYRKQVTGWGAKSNPEFPAYSAYPMELLVAKEELLNVTRSLEKFWPQQGHSSKLEPLDYQPVSDEAVDYFHGDDEDEEEDSDSGSGSGFYKNSFETDDEDLINGYHDNEGSGSSSSTDNAFNNNNNNNSDDIMLPELPPTKPTTSVNSVDSSSGSGGIRLRSCHANVIFIAICSLVLIILK